MSVSFFVNGKKKKANEISSEVFSGLRDSRWQEYTRKTLGPIVEELSKNEGIQKLPNTARLYCFCKAFCEEKEFQREQFGHVLAHVLENLGVKSELITRVMSKQHSHCGCSHHEVGFARFFLCRFWPKFLDEDIQYENILHLYDMFYPPLPVVPSSPLSLGSTGPRQIVLKGICEGVNTFSSDDVRRALDDMYNLYLFDCDPVVGRSCKRLIEYLNVRDPFNLCPAPSGSIGFCAFVMFEHLHPGDLGGDAMVEMEESVLKRRYFELFFSLHDDVVTGNADSSPIAKFHDRMKKDGIRIMSKTHITAWLSEFFPDMLKKQDATDDTFKPQQLQMEITGFLEHFMKIWKDANERHSKVANKPIFTYYET